KISRILIRSDKIFPEESVRLAETILNSKDRYKLKESDAKSAWVINCPKCQRQMHRQFFVYSYPVEIDRCVYCSGIWFDKSELEILQYLYEHKELLYNIKSY
ncbi:MAG: zf-TFIIB domain-containing protein, partial [Candidatus Omnitrophota bacterium]